MYVCYVFARSQNHCCRGTTTICSLISVALRMLLSTITSIERVVMKTQHWVISALLSYVCHQQYKNFETVAMETQQCVLLV
jgi:hypothetical protein